MKTRTLKTVIALFVAVAALAGCGQAPDQTKEAPRTAKITKDPQSQPVSAPRADAPTTKELLTYYNANLKDAQAEWHKCLAKGLQNVSDEDKPRCVAAQNAWQNQPYKPNNGGSK